ncbi:MAG TPA: TylF/MycF/NovP-related O-methyltransferase [Chlamydiales bacterium]|nr:TylF/MycF/NovP-related O-methyltransferase [Chlamydiales bacterium]
MKCRNAIRSVIRKFGYDLIRFPKLDGPYEKIQVKSYYAPWKGDLEFQNCFSMIQTHSLVDQHRCYELWELCGQSAKLDGALLEIGVWRGGTGALIAKRAELCHISNPVYLCDTFQGVVKATRRDDFYKGGEHQDTSPKIVQKLLNTLNLKNVQILPGIFPEDTGARISEQKFRFCHVDVDVYQSTLDIIDWVWPRLVSGGIIVFDDYGLPTCKGVRDFVNERKHQKDLISLHNLNGHAIWIKI